MVMFTGVVPAVSRTTALVAQPLGAVFACTCKRVTVTALSVVQVAPVHVEVSAPGRNTFCSARGLEENASPVTGMKPEASGSVTVRFAVRDGVITSLKFPFVSVSCGPLRPREPIVLEVAGDTFG